MTQSGPSGTRDRLVRAAITLMWDRSFRATGVDDLCEHAEAKKGSFYHFFPSKTDLAIEAIETLWVQAKEAIFEPIFSRPESGLNQLRHLVETVYKHQAELAAEKGTCLGCPFGNLGQEMARQDERIRSTLQGIFLANCDYFEGAIRRAVEAGEIPAGDNRQRAINVFAVMQGAMLLAKVADDPKLILDSLPAVLSSASA